MIPMETPRRILLGRVRFRTMVARVVVAWWPIPAAAVTLWALPWLSLVGVVICLAAVELRRPGSVLGRLRSAWWRTRWWSDARACGLCVIADPGVNATHEAGRPRGIELAPSLRRLHCNRTTRTYVVKALPDAWVRTDA